MMIVGVNFLFENKQILLINSLRPNEVKHVSGQAHH